MKDPNRLPHPIKITFGPHGVTVKRTSWREYHRLNPVVTYVRGDDGVPKIVENRAK